MKKVLLAAGVLLITAVSFGQKKEIKKAEKAISSADYVEAMNQLNAAETLLASADDKQKATFYKLKAIVLAKSANKNFDKMKLAAAAYAKAAEVAGGINAELAAGMGELRTDLINSAVSDQNANNHLGASEKLFASYMMTKQDTSDLYYAAGSAVRAKNNDLSVKYYEMLLDLGYQGNTSSFVATNKETGEVKTFNTKGERDISVLSKEYIKPDIKVESSKRGEILRNLTLIYMDMGKESEAKSLLAKARAENPNDTSLLQAEANMAYKMNDLETYNTLMEKVIASDPTNPVLHFNVGVSAAGLGDKAKAFKYYNQALKLDPNYRVALINYAVLKLDDEKVIVDEMNSLGNSRADNAKYEVLKDKKSSIYAEAVPYLEKAIEIGAKEENIDIMKTLMSIYSQLGEDAKFKAMKAKVEGM